MLIVVVVLVLLFGISLGGHIAKWTAGTKTTEPEAQSKFRGAPMADKNKAVQTIPIEKFDFNEWTVEALRDRLAEAGQSKQGTKEYLKIRLQQFYKNKGLQPMFEAND